MTSESATIAVAPNGCWCEANHQNNPVLEPGTTIRISSTDFSPGEAAYLASQLVSRNNILNLTHHQDTGFTPLTLPSGERIWVYVSVDFKFALHEVGVSIELPPKPVAMSTGVKIRTGDDSLFEKHPKTTIRL